MISPNRITQITHALLALMLGSFYGLVAGGVGWWLSSLYDEQMYAGFASVLLFTVGTIIGTRHVHQYDLPLISRGNKIALLGYGFLLAALILSGMVSTWGQHVSLGMFMLCIAIGAIVLHLYHNASRGPRSPRHMHP